MQRGGRRAEPARQRAVVGHPGSQPGADGFGVGRGDERTEAYDGSGGPAVRRARLHGGVQTAIVPAVQHLPQTAGGDHDAMRAAADHPPQRVHQPTGLSVTGRTDDESERTAPTVACGATHARPFQAIENGFHLYSTSRHRRTHLVGPGDQRLHPAGRSRSGHETAQRALAAQLNHPGAAGHLGKRASPCGRVRTGGPPAATVLLRRHREPRGRRLPSPGSRVRVSTRHRQGLPGRHPSTWQPSRATGVALGGHPQDDLVHPRKLNLT